MTSNWEEFYSKAPKPGNYDEEVKVIQEFVSEHRVQNRKIALVTVSEFAS